MNCCLMIDITNIKDYVEFCVVHDVVTVTVELTQHVFIDLDLEIQTPARLIT